MVDIREDDGMPLSSNPNLKNGFLKVPADSDLPVKDLVDAKKDGANVVVEGDGSVTIDVGNKKEGTS